MENETPSERARRAAQTRNRCVKCGAGSTVEVDGSKIGGLPGITYRHCYGCGWSQAKTRKQRPKL